MKFGRMNSTYQVVNKEGYSVPFRMNPVQANVLQNLHNRNVILKARQLGMTTASVLYMLDECLWNRNLSAGIISYNLQHAQHIFKKIIGHALETIRPELKPLVGILSYSAHEITFNNGSSLRVDTTLRGGTTQLVLVSEFGKTCARTPQKAEEIITGTLQSVPKNGRIIIESTGEGNDGFFAEMVQSASIRGNDNLNGLEYKLFFFPWMDEPSYVMTEKVSFGVELTDYFNDIEIQSGRKITLEQRYWYAAQRQILGEKIKQEFPSTISEAFLSSSDAYYYAEYIEKAYKSNRCLTNSLYDALLPVFVAMDIGVNDLTVMVFFQIAHGEIRIFDYYEDKNKGVDFYCRFLLQDKKYLYHTIFLPHDSAKKDGSRPENVYERDFRRLFSHTNTKINVIKRTEDKNLDISHAKIKFERCVFNISRVKPLLDMLGKYRKRWHEPTGRYLDEPYHDLSSNYADAFRYAMNAVTHIETVSSLSGSLEKHKAVVEGRARRVI